jgi:hypothetical protein
LQAFLTYKLDWFSAFASFLNTGQSLCGKSSRLIAV